MGCLRVCASAFGVKLSKWCVTMMVPMNSRAGMSPLAYRTPSTPRRVDTTQARPIPVCPIDGFALVRSAVITRRDLMRRWYLSGSVVFLGCIPLIDMLF